MIVTKTPFIIPTRLEWLALLAMIGIFGFIAQVRLVSSFATQTKFGTSLGNSFYLVQVLLTMGLQRETAGRGSMAVYTQVSLACSDDR
jgi:hypothetical protein